MTEQLKPLTSEELDGIKTTIDHHIASGRVTATLSVELIDRLIHTARRALPDDGQGPMQDQIVEQWLVDTGWKRLPALNVFVKQFAHCRIEVWTPERDSGWCIYASDKIPTLLLKQATRSQLTKLVEALGGAQ